MYNNPTPLQNFWQNTTTIQKIAIILIPVFLIIIVIVSVLFIINSERNHINITNFSEYCSAGNNYKSATEQSIWSSLQSTGVASNTYLDASIRQDTYSEVASDDVITATFIVDIPLAEQSYSTTISWNTKEDIRNSNEPGDYNITVSCPLYTDIIYTNNKCSTSTNSIEDLYNYLPVKETDVEVPFSIKIARYNSVSEKAGQKYLSVLIQSCNNEDKYKIGVNEVLNWLQTRYLEPSDYNIEYTEVCSIN